MVVIPLIPVIYMACSIVSFAVRGVILVAHAVDPLPAELGPQVTPARTATVVHQVRSAPEQREVVEYYWSRDCRPCYQFAEDSSTDVEFRKAFHARYEIRSFEFERTRERAAARGVTEVPAWYVPARKHLVQGYEGPRALWDALKPPPPPLDPPPGREAAQDASGEASAATDSTFPDWDPVPSFGERLQTSSGPASETPAPGPIALVKQSLLEALRIAIAAAVASFMSWRAQQSFLKRRVIDKAVRKALAQGRQKAETSPAGRAALHVADAAMQR